jgi:hypothetical protein
MTDNSIQIMHDLANGEFIESYVNMLYSSRVIANTEQAFCHFIMPLWPRSRLEVQLMRCQKHFFAKTLHRRGGTVSSTRRIRRGSFGQRFSILQWLYLGRIIFNNEDPENKISAVVELAGSETIRTIMLKDLKEL